MKFSLRDTLREHPNKYFIFLFRVILSRANLERIRRLKGRKVAEEEVKTDIREFNFVMKGLDGS